MTNTMWILIVILGTLLGYKIGYHIGEVDKYNEVWEALYEAGLIKEWEKSEY